MESRRKSRGQGEAPHREVLDGAAPGAGGAGDRCPPPRGLSNAPVDHVGRNTEGTPVSEEHLMGPGGGLSLRGAAKCGPGDRRGHLGWLHVPDGQARPSLQRAPAQSKLRPGEQAANRPLSWLLQPAKASVNGSQAWSRFFARTCVGLNGPLLPVRSTSSLCRY